MKTLHLGIASIVLCLAVVLVVLVGGLTPISRSPDPGRERRYAVELACLSAALVSVAFGTTALARSRGRSRMAKAGITLGVLCEMAIAAYVGFLVFDYATISRADAIRRGWGDIPFDTRIWKSEKLTSGIHPPAEGDNTRARMIDDLVTHHLRAGMTRPDAEKLVGEEDYGFDNDSMYILIHWPNLSQNAYSRRRWGAAEPYLTLTYRKNRLVNIKVGRD
jgi:hypothetical protein